MSVTVSLQIVGFEFINIMKRNGSAMGEVLFHCKIYKLIYGEARPKQIIYFQTSLKI